MVCCRTVVGLRLRTVASRRPRSPRYSPISGLPASWRRSVLAAQDITAAWNQSSSCGTRVALIEGVPQGRDPGRSHAVQLLDLGFGTCTNCSRRVYPARARVRRPGGALGKAVSSWLGNWVLQIASRGSAFGTETAISDGTHRSRQNRLADIRRALCGHCLADRRRALGGVASDLHSGGPSSVEYSLGVQSPRGSEPRLCCPQHPRNILLVRPRRRVRTGHDRPLDPGA